MNKEYYELLKVGLTEGEAKVYLALSELGSSSVGPIVKKSGVAYSNIYDILERLIKKGIASFVIKSKTKYFQSAPASNLVEYLDNKEKEIVNQREQLKKVIDDLEKIRDLKDTQEAEVFVGKKGLKSAYQKMMKGVRKKDELLFFYLHKDEYAEESDQFYYEIGHITMKANIKGIANKEYKKSWFAKVAKGAKTWNLKFVDFPIPANIDIYKDMVMIVTWRPSVVGVLIHSKELAENFRNYFYEVWKRGK